MVEELFPTYNLHIKVRSPVHIGSGERMQPIQWKLENGRLYVLDLERWVGSVVQSGDPKKASLWTAALEKGVLPQEYARDWKKWPLYDIPYTWGNVQPKEILPFIQQGGLGAFFPGSSLKGSLRSALLRGIAALDSSGVHAIAPELDREMERAGKLKTFSQDFEAQYFSAHAPKSKQPNYDINRLWMVRDQKLRFEALQAVQVQIFSVSTQTKLNSKPAAIFLEVLRPGFEFNMQMVWQAHLTQHQQAQDVLGFPKNAQRWLYLAQYCREAALRLIEQEYHFYDRHIETRVAEWYQQLHQTALDLPPNAFLLPIGYGSGFDAKTITRLLGNGRFESVCKAFRNTNGLGRPGNTRDGRWLGPADAPKSRKLVVDRTGQKLPLGWVEVHMQLLDGQPDWLNALQGQRRDAPCFPVHAPLGQSVPAPTPVRTSGGHDKPDDLKVQRQPSPDSSPLSRFTDIPKPGDRFYATMLYLDEGRAWLEIPGLSADDQAIAFIPDAELGGKKLAEGKKVLCRVVDVKPDPKQKNFYLVHCGLEF